jgi:type I restriction enzyme S subunit
LKDKDVVQYLYSLCGAAAQQAIYLKSLKVLSIPLPPLSLQQSFASRITYIEQQKQAIQSSIDKFQEMLDGAMDEYFGDD